MVIKSQIKTYITMNINSDTSVYDYYKLKSCIDPNRLYWNKLILNKNAFHFIEKHINILDKETLIKLSRNPFAIEILEKHQDKIAWNDFVNNPNAIHIVDKNIDLCFKSLDWRGRSDLIRHPDFIHIIEKHSDKIIDNLLCSSNLPIIASMHNHILIDLLEKYMKKYPEKIPDKTSNYFWNGLCENPNAIRIIKNNLNKLTNYSWQILAKNPNAIQIIAENLDKLEDLGWNNLSNNPNAISILEKNIEKIYWYGLSTNLNGFKILEKYPEKIACYLFVDYENFSVNLPIFEIDYEAIQKKCSIYKEELMEVALHPSRIKKYLEEGMQVKDLDKYI